MASNQPGLLHETAVAYMVSLVAMDIQYYEVIIIGTHSIFVGTSGKDKKGKKKLLEILNL